MTPSSGLIPMYINAIGGNTSEGVNLYTYGASESGTSASLLNLYINGHGEFINNHINLFVNGYNSGGDPSGFWSGYNSNIKLYIRGEGFADGYSVYGSSLNAFIKAGTAAESGINTYIYGHDISSKSIYLYTMGVSGVKTESLDLYTNGIDDYYNDVNLFIRGYQPR